MDEKKDFETFSLPCRGKIESFKALFALSKRMSFFFALDERNYFCGWAAGKARRQEEPQNFFFGYAEQIPQRNEDRLKRSRIAD